MKEQGKIKYPTPGLVEVSSETDFIYIMRKDGVYAMAPIAELFASAYFLDSSEVRPVFEEAYDMFFEELTGCLLDVFSQKGKFELHLYEPEVLDEAERQKTGELPIISLDPLMIEGVYPFKISRGYFTSGIKDFGQVERPGSASLRAQGVKLTDAFSEKLVSVVEDDIFSGGSVVKALETLKQAGIMIAKMIPGIQIGHPTKLSEMGIAVDPVVAYQSADGTDIFSKVDLGDPRDYLLGASGLVIKMPLGKYGRAPYILPFVSTAARASIPDTADSDFARMVLEANLHFFTRIKDFFGKPLLLQHMDPHFAMLMQDVYGFPMDTQMSNIVVWALENLDQVWKYNLELGQLHEQIESLGLPQKLIFLDVNGTIITEDSSDGAIDSQVKQQLIEEVQRLLGQGVMVGLCSDSPLPQLIEFAEKAGLNNAPIIAENGNILYFAGKSLVLNALPDKNILKTQIQKKAKHLGFVQLNDAIAPEFGGEPTETTNETWTFGANRQTSISVFGPAPLIEELGEYFKGLEGKSVDCSPDYGYFAIHPGNYRQNKGQTLKLLAQFGYGVMMIGNSKSDWVNPDSGVICAFVGGSRISTEIADLATYVSQKPIIEGVVDILQKILY